MIKIFLEVKILLRRRKFVITSPKLKAFVYNKKIYNPVLGIMFALSSISISMILAEMSKDVQSGADKILFAHLIWVGFYAISLWLYSVQVKFSPLVFAVSTYFVVDYTVGSLLSAAYDVHYLPVTDILGILFIVIIVILYLWLKRLKTKITIPQKPESYEEMKWHLMDALSMLFFMPGFLVIGGLSCISNVFMNQILFVVTTGILFVITAVFVIISLPVYGEHFRMSKSLFATLNCFIGHSAFYLLGFLSCLGESNNLISNMFWLSLFDALNLIT